MSDIVAILARLDFLSALFLLGSLAMLWVAWKVIADDTPITGPDEDADEDVDEPPKPAAPARRRPAA